AKEQIRKICQAYADDDVIFSKDHSVPKLKEIKGAPEGDSTLLIKPIWDQNACADSSKATAMGFKAIGAEKCEGYYMRTVVGCGEFENPNGEEYWNWDEENKEACVYWTVLAY
ncbi:MAG: hypothetical protein Q9163_003572, partial [Psora crenata]